MEVQIFGIRKSPETRKALRFFAERRVKTHFVDLQERAASPGELRRFAQKFGVEALVDRGSRRFADLGLGAARLSEERWLEQARGGAAAAAHAARAPAAAAHGRRRRGRLARVDRPVTQLAVSGVAVEFGATRLLGRRHADRGPGREVGHHRPERRRQDHALPLITGETDAERGHAWPGRAGSGTR